MQLFYVYCTNLNFYGIKSMSLACINLIYYILLTQRKVNWC